MSDRAGFLTARCAFSLAFPVSATGQAAPIAVERFGLYVVSDDLERAARFYQLVFGRPKVRVPAMIGFEVAGGLYAVVDRRRFAPTAVRGDTTRGYIKVADARATYRLLAGLVPSSLVGGVVTEGNFSLFRLRDPDGNIIEFYALTPS